MGRSGDTGTGGVVRLGRGAKTVPAAEERPSVFVVDDDISVRELLEAMLSHEGWLVEVFASADSFLRHPRPRVPSCLVLDVNLPDLSGLDLQELVASEGIGLPIIFITGYGDVPMTVRAMKAGAAEFLTKPFENEVLLHAIRQAIERSRAVLRDDLALQVVRDRHASLSPREREVMALVVSGLLNKEVAAALGISEITVKAHRGKVMRKMRASSFADLVNMGGKLS